MSRNTLRRTLAAIRRAVPALPELSVAASGQVVGRYHGAVIGSAFQAWRATDGRQVLAVEAYARSCSKHGAELSPWQLFADGAGSDQLVPLDRLSRTVHALNHFMVAGADRPLVLNVDARLLDAVPQRHGEFFGKLLQLLGVDPQRIVIEIRTTHQFDLTRLREILASYRRHGFAVAVNAEGAIHARSLAQLLAPDYLMLDAGSFPADELGRYVALLAAAKVRVAVKRIETQEQATVTRLAGAAWVQGHYFDRLAATLPATTAEAA